MTVTPTLVRCSDVCVVHDGQTRALDGVSFSVGPGERVAVWGRSGSGKTTLLHVIGGLVRPTSGAVTRLDDQRFAYVFQSPSLLPYFTALENVRFAARIASSEVDPAELLALVGLDGKRHHLPSELSGGEQQRVSIARALAQAPVLLLCDEPTGRLDSDTATRVLDLIDALQHRIGFGLVAATHDLGLLPRYAREIGMLDGRIVSDERSR
jgi:putative ABC transport system ATP-binding protein